MAFSRGLFLGVKMETKNNSFPILLDQDDAKYIERVQKDFPRLQRTRVWWIAINLVISIFLIASWWGLVAVLQRMAQQPGFGLAFACGTMMGITCGASILYLFSWLGWIAKVNERGTKLLLRYHDLLVANGLVTPVTPEFVED